MPLQIAESLLRGGAFSETMEALDEMPSQMSGSDVGMQLRVECAQHLGQWQLGEVYADILRKGPLPGKAVAERFFKAMEAARK